MTDLCEPCEGPSSEPEPQKSAMSGPAPSPAKQASPSVSELILWAVATSPKCQGLSLEALKKIVTKAGYNVARNRAHFRRVLRGLVSKGLLKQMSGMGAAGSFHAGKKKREVKKSKGAARRRKAPGRGKTPSRRCPKASQPTCQGRKRLTTK